MAGDEDPQFPTGNESDNNSTSDFQIYKFEIVEKYIHKVSMYDTDFDTAKKRAINLVLEGGSLPNNVELGECKVLSIGGPTGSYE